MAIESVAVLVLIVIAACIEFRAHSSTKVIRRYALYAIVAAIVLFGIVPHENLQAAQGQVKILVITSIANVLFTLRLRTRRKNDMLRWTEQRRVPLVEIPSDAGES